MVRNRRLILGLTVAGLLLPAVAVARHQSELAAENVGLLELWLDQVASELASAAAVVAASDG